MKVDFMVLVRHCWDFDEGFRSTFIFHLTLISCSRGAYLEFEWGIYKFHVNCGVEPFTGLLLAWYVRPLNAWRHAEHIPSFHRLKKPFKCQSFIKTLYTHYLPLDKQSAGMSHTKWKNHFDWQCGQKRSINSLVRMNCCPEAELVSGSAVCCWAPLDTRLIAPGR